MRQLHTQTKSLLLILCLVCCALITVTLSHLHRPPSSSAGRVQTKEETLRQNALCEKTLEQNSCIADSYEVYARAAGVLAALALVHEQILAQPAFAGTCHEVMHRIGHVAVHEFGGMKNAYIYGNIDCANGYFHGVVEETMRMNVGQALTPIEIQHFCDNITPPASSTPLSALRNCVHGLGHALVYEYHGALPPALESCVDVLGDGNRGECLAGAFMERATTELSLASSSNPHSNPSLTCSSVIGDAYPCWVALSAFTISQSEHNLRAALAFCQTFNDGVYRASCGEGLGRAVTVGLGEASLREEYCRAHAGELAGDCVRGSSEERMKSTSSPLYSPAFGALLWGTEVGSDSLIGNFVRLE